jgi:hypothetical protein
MNTMDQGWYGPPVGQDNVYHHTQDWLTQPQQRQQQDQHAWNGDGVWNHGPYNNEYQGFDGFQRPQYDGAHDSQHDDAQGSPYDDVQDPQHDGAQDLQDDGPPSEDEEGEQVEEIEKVEEVEEEDVKPKVSHGGYRALIKSEKAYNLSKKARIRAETVEKKEDGVVSGAPKDDPGKLYWIGQLFYAFKNTLDIKDKPCKNGKPAQSAQRLGGHYYPDIEIEKVCWKIYVSSFSSAELWPSI